jgi:hypothetical protein
LNKINIIVTVIRYLPKSVSDTFKEFSEHYEFCVASSMKCKTTNFMRALNTEFNGNLHDKKCDKQKNEIIISVAKYLKIE